MDDRTEQKELDSNVEELVQQYSWMVRPCIIYKEEYSDCTSIRSRLHQQFVSGTFEDCSQWKYDYDNCLKWKNDNNTKAFKDLIDSELKRRQKRLGAHNANNVWKRRQEPPAEWNAPLPEWMEEKIKASYLTVKAEEQKQGKLTGNSFCVIS